MNARRATACMWLCLAAIGCAHTGAAQLANPTPVPNPEQLLEIARAADQLGDNLRAQQYLLAAARSGASPKLTLPLLLRSYVADGQYRLAIDTARDYLRAHPEDARLRLLLASLYEATQLEAAAIEQYERVLSELPSDADAHFALAELLHELGREPGRADQHFRAYLALAPHGDNAAEARASLLEELP